MLLLYMMLGIDLDNPGPPCDGLEVNLYTTVKAASHYHQISLPASPLNTNNLS
jgi:hypothetical protein